MLEASRSMQVICLTMDQKLTVASKPKVRGAL